MKVRVEQEFVDIRTKKLHKVGDVLDINEKRFAEIQKVSKNLVTEIKEAKTGASKNAPAKGKE